MEIYTRELEKLGFYCQYDNSLVDIFDYRNRLEKNFISVVYKKHDYDEDFYIIIYTDSGEPKCIYFEFWGELLDELKILLKPKIKVVKSADVKKILERFCSINADIYVNVMYDLNKVLIEIDEPEDVK